MRHAHGRGLRVRADHGGALHPQPEARRRWSEIETRYGLRVAVRRDDALIPPAFRLERMRARTAADPMPVLPPPTPAPVEIDEPIPPDEIAADTELAAADGPFDDRAHAAEPRAEAREGFDDQGGENGGGRRRRRRRRGRGRDGEERGGAERGGAQQPPREPRHFDAPHDAPAIAADASVDGPVDAVPQAEGAPGQMTGEPRPQHPHHDNDEGARRRRRGRRGGRRRGRRDGEPQQQHGAGQQDPFADPRYPDAAAPPENAIHVAPSPPVQREEPPPRRIEGPGDAYDWPWNRRAERFPDEVARDAEAAPADAPVSTESAPLTAPPRVAELPHEPDPAPQPRERPLAAEIPPPVDETPAGPPRKGWWRRLTQ